MSVHPEPFVERPSSPIDSYFCIFVKSVGHICVGLFLHFLYCTVNLCYLSTNITFLIAVAVKQAALLGGVMGSPIFFGIVFTILVPLPVHVNF